MTIPRLALIALLLPLALRAGAEDAPGPTAQEKAARDFAFDGVRMGMPLAEFKKAHPTLPTLKDGCDEAGGVVCYGLDSEKASACLFYFCDGALIKTRVMYFADLLDKMGGSAPIAKQLLKKFGTPEGWGADDEAKRKKDAVIWRFPTVHRSVSVTEMPVKGEGTMLVVEVVDTAAEERITERKQAKAKTGLED